MSIEKSLSVLKAAIESRDIHSLVADPWGKKLYFKGTWQYHLLKKVYDVVIYLSACFSNHTQYNLPFKNVVKVIIKVDQSFSKLKETLEGFSKQMTSYSSLVDYKGRFLACKALFSKLHEMQALQPVPFLESLFSRAGLKPLLNFTRIDCEKASKLEEIAKFKENLPYEAFLKLSEKSMLYPEEEKLVLDHLKRDKVDTLHTSLSKWLSLFPEKEEKRLEVEVGLDKRDPHFFHNEAEDYLKWRSELKEGAQFTFKNGTFTLASPMKCEFLHGNYLFFSLKERSDFFLAVGPNRALLEIEKKKGFKTILEVDKSTGAALCLKTFKKPSDEAILSFLKSKILEKRTPCPLLIDDLHEEEGGRIFFLHPPFEKKEVDFWSFEEAVYKLSRGDSKQYLERIKKLFPERKEKALSLQVITSLLNDVKVSTVHPRTSELQKNLLSLRDQSVKRWMEKNKGSNRMQLIPKIRKAILSLYQKKGFIGRLEITQEEVIEEVNRLR